VLKLLETFTGDEGRDDLLQSPLEMSRAHMWAL
jgi:hypothetical protein